MIFYEVLGKHIIISKCKNEKSEPNRRQDHALFGLLPRQVIVGLDPLDLVNSLQLIPDFLLQRLPIFVVASRFFDDFGLAFDHQDVPFVFVLALVQIIGAVVASPYYLAQLRQAIFAYRIVTCCVASLLL